MHNTNQTIKFKASCEHTHIQAIRKQDYMHNRKLGQSSKSSLIYVGSPSCEPDAAHFKASWIGLIKKCFIIFNAA